MQKHFKLISISHKTAPIQLRERLALNENQIKNLLNRYKEIFGIAEILILSTCNRIEIYYYSENDISSALRKILILEQGFTFNDFSSENFINISDHDQAVEYLFRVAAGLESQVIGDIQITNQVKKAYQWSADLDCSGPFLHRLLHTIFFTNKRIIQETSFRDGAASVSYAAYELVQELSETILSPKITVIGLGEIGTDLVKNLSNSNIKQVILCNRNEEKGIELAKIYGFEYIPFEQHEDTINKADIIISAISQSKPFFTKEKLENISSLSYKYFIDLSVPRSIENLQKDNILIYNVDDINIRTQTVLEKRKKDIPRVECIIEESLKEFNQWTKEMIFSPTIQKIKEALEEIRKQEIAKYMKELDERELGKVEKITKSVIQKIIKLPAIQLKAACRRGETQILVDVLNELFDLEKNYELN